MIRLFVLIAIRRLIQERVYVLINIFSLALGIASFLILALYLRSELSYDQHHSNHENIYRLHSIFSGGAYGVTSEGLGPLLVQDYPQLGQYTRFRNATQNILRYGDNRQTWENIYLADENLFQVFDHTILAGDPETALSDPYSIAISESFAQSYFGDADPIGKTLEGDSLSFRVTLMFEDLPENSHLKYEAIYPYSIMNVFVPDYEDNYIRGLWGIGIYTYLTVPEEFDLAGLSEISDSFYNQYMAERGVELNSSFELGIQPLADLHFGESLQADLPQGNIFYIYGFAAVALFILIVACINYMNLATARATKRSREVGMRKVLGAERSQLIGQFIGESMVFTSIALVLAYGLVAIALSLTPIGSLMGKEELLGELFQPLVIGGCLLLGLIVGVISGCYPAFYLSSISPMAALVKSRQSWHSGFSVRQLLVLTQLSISIGVISATLLMSAQMNYVASKPLGFDKQNQVTLPLKGADIIEQLPTIKSELLAYNNINSVTETIFIPGNGNAVNLINVDNAQGVMEPITIDRIVVGPEFINTLGIEIIQGRNLDNPLPADGGRFALVNETLARQQGWENPIGMRMGNPEDPMEIIGVTRDFHYAPLHSEIGPLALWPLAYNFENTSAAARPLQSTNLIINISGDGVTETLGIIESTLTRLDPGHIFDPVFLDDSLNRLYSSETNLMRLTEIFAGICILISAIGLFGLAAFTTQQRFKEIGIRKVLGASSFQIVSLLSNKLILLLVIAAIPSSLISFYAINQWKANFAYTTSISLMPFLIASLTVAAITLATVTLQSLRGSHSNPVDALRYE